MGFLAVRPTRCVRCGKSLRGVATMQNLCPEERAHDEPKMPNDEECVSKIKRNRNIKSEGMNNKNMEDLTLQRIENKVE